MIFIGDVAGQYDCLLRLVEKLPKEKILFLGDLVDRGPKSKEVVEYVMKNHDTLLGNHEHMMIDYFLNNSLYDEGLWLVNGGKRTLDSYGGKLDEGHIRWLASRPLSFENDHVFASHAPLDPYMSVQAASVLTHAENGLFEERVSDSSLIWNRRKPNKKKFKDSDGLSAEPYGKFKLQIHGHNAGKEIEWFHEDDDGLEPPFAICIDTSWGRKLTALWVSDETGMTAIYQEPYETV